MSRWFRLYDDLLDDPKVQRLSPELFKTWVNLMCVASKTGGKLPTASDIAFRLRISEQDAEQRISDLVLAGLLDIQPDKSFEVHGWRQRQCPSDTSTGRMRKLRAKRRQKDAPKTGCDVTCDGGDGKSDGLEQNRTEKERIEIPVTPLPPKGDVVEQDLKFKFGLEGGSWAKAKREEVRQKTLHIAEGFGLPVEAMLAEAKSKERKSLDGYFQWICRRELRVQLPGISDDVLKAAFAGEHEAKKTVLLLLAGDA